jgi:hypothetical protein
VLYEPWQQCARNLPIADLSLLFSDLAAALRILRKLVNGRGYQIWKDTSATYTRNVWQALHIKIIGTPDHLHFVHSVVAALSRPEIRLRCADCAVI